MTTASISAQSTQDETLRDFLCQLQTPTRDFVDGALLQPPQWVLRNPLAPDVVRKDDKRRREEFIKGGYAWDEPTRLRTWQPSLSNQVPEATARFPAASAESFVNAIKKNLAETTNELLPLPRIPSYLTIVPLQVWIKAAKSVADLGPILVDSLCRSSGLPAVCPLSSEYRQWLSSCNKMLVYELQGSLGICVHVVVAFVSPFRFEPLRGVEMVRLNMPSLEAIQQTYTDWGKTNPSKARFVLYTIGSWEIRAEVPATESDDSFTLLSTPAGINAPISLWVSSAPADDAQRPALADFIDQLKPLTRDERAAVVAAVVEARRATGFRGSIELNWLSDKTGYRHKTVKQAMFDLARGGDYRVERNQAGRLYIEKSERFDGPGLKPPRTATARRFLYVIRLILFASITWGLSLLGTWARGRHGWRLPGTAVALFLSWLVILIGRWWYEIFDKDSE